MNKIHRYMSFFLCLALILFCLSSPMQRSASASATAAIVIGIAGSTVSVEAVIGVVATILVAVGFVSGTVDEVVSKSRTFYNNCSSTLRKWFDEVAADVIDGTSVFRIPSTVQNELKDKLGDKTPDNIPYLLIPGTLTNLATLTGADVFIQDVIGAIEAGNSIQEITNTRLLMLYGLLNTSFADVEDFITSQTSTISTGFANLASNLGSKITSLSTTLSSQLDSVEVSIDAMSSSLSDDLTDLKTLYSSFGNQTLSKLNALNTSIQSVNTSIQNLDLSDSAAGFADLSVKLDTLAQLFESSSSSLGFIEIISSEQSMLIQEALDKLGYDPNFIEATFEEVLNIGSLMESYFHNVETILDAISIDLDWQLADIESGIDALSGYFDSAISAQTQKLIWNLNHNSIVYQLSDLIELVSNSFADIKTSIQSIAGTTTADPGAGDDSRDEADKQKIPLMPHVNNGFQQGENYIGNVYTFLDEELAAFRVAALIFEEFAHIPFFYKLIITSCSVGLIGTLLGMALYAQSFNLYQKRREEAAQARAHDRMAARRVDLSVHV